VSICVAIASANPVKKRATLEAVRVALGLKDVNAEVVEVEHGMPAQPFGDEETLRGARTRAEGARALRPDADYWVGLEGGVLERDGELEAMAWAVVLGRVGDGELRRGESRTATFTLPREIADLVRSGVELGEATDQVFGQTDTKRGTGTIGPLTGGVIDRVSYYAHAMVLALVPFRNPDLTFADSADRVEA
jgi:inosine/xanthosine triphosphatase